MHDLLPVPATLRGSLVYPDAAFVARNVNVLEALATVLSVKVKGASHNAAVQAGKWDGRSSLVKRYEGAWAWPVGLLPAASKFLRECGFELKVKDTRPPAPQLTTGATYKGLELRDYQEAAIEKACKDRGVMTARGILKLPIRAGKTVIAGGIIGRLGVRTVFIVPSSTLVGQTARSLRKSLPDAEIGTIVEGEWTPAEITVTTIQALIARPADGLELLCGAGLLICDEAHHFASPGWRKLIIAAATRYRIGLSGTVWMDEEQNPDEIYLRAATGPVLYSVSMARMIEKGWLKAPEVVIFPIPTVPRKEQKSNDWNGFYHRAIVTNQARNGAIADIAYHAVQLGLRVLVDTDRTEQLTEIHGMLKARGVAVEAVAGSGRHKTKVKDRDAAVQRLSCGDTQVIVGTVYGEGVDMPDLEVVINAAGGKSRTAGIQRLRNLTAIAGKGHVLVVDFDDKGSPKLREHSDLRRAMYASIHGFNLHDAPAPSSIGGLGEYRIPAHLCSLLLAGRTPPALDDIDYSTAAPPTGDLFQWRNTP